MSKKYMGESIKPPLPEEASSARIVFMGTPRLASELLEALLDQGYNVVGVVTKPDAKSGREGTLVQSSVRQVAESRGLAILTPKTLDREFEKELRALRPDLILVIAYGKILPESIINLPRLGCLNIHYSLLPRFRGSSPIQHALLFGDTETGVTLMQIDKGVDTGPLIAYQKIAIDPHDTTATLTPKLNAAARELLLTALPPWIKGEVKSVPQAEEGVVLCQLIERADGKVEWANDAQSIYNRFRAFDPWPGIFTYWKKKDTFIRLKLLKIRPHLLPIEQVCQLGEVFQLSDSIAVQTGAGAILLESVQLEGKAPTSIQEFLNGNPDFIGSFLV